MEDAAALTSRAILDPQCANRIVHIRPQGHHLSQDDLISTWTQVSGQVVKRTPAAALAAGITGGISWESMGAVPVVTDYC